MNFLENITFRRTRTRSEPNNDESSDNIPQALNCTTNSLPDISEDEDVYQINILKEEIASLASQLKSAHEEIELLSIENSNLKKSNEDYKKKNDIYKNIVNSPGKNKNKINTPLKKSKKNLKSTESQTINISEKDHSLCSNLNKTIIDNNTEKCVTNINRNTQGKTRQTTKYRSKTQKICLISSETSNRLYTMTETASSIKYETCHYRKPKCGLRQLLDGIEGKVKGFTYSDYCIIFIGEEDFRATHNYIELVMFIRKTLLNINHTNFIICLPTFKYMKNANIMFNSRIETFNNLLYLDVNSFKYAHILDSNLNLPYDHGTYNKHDGSLNKHGSMIIVSDLLDLIHDLGNLNTLHQEVDSSPENQSQNGIPKEPEQTNSQFFL